MTVSFGQQRRPYHGPLRRPSVRKVRLGEIAIFAANNAVALFPVAKVDVQAPGTVPVSFTPVGTSEKQTMVEYFVND